MAKTNTKPELRFAGFIEVWQKEFVGTYYDFKNGLNKSKEYFGHGKPIVNFTDVFHNRGLLANQVKGKVDVTSDEINNYSVKKGDLFFTRTSETIEEIGQPSVMLDEPKQAVFSGFVLRARSINEDPLEIVFKQYAFFTNSFRSEMVKKSSMTTRALTSGTAIKKMLFSFPKSKDEQLLIGNFFQNLDQLITEHQQKHSKLQALKKAMLSKMFPQEGQTVPEIRFKGFEGEWIEKELGSLCKVAKSGGTPTTTNKEYYDGNIPFLAISDMTNQGKYITKTSKSISQKGIENSASWLVPENSIIYSMYASVGFVSINKVPLATSQAVINLILKEEVDLEYIYYYLSFYQQHIHKFIETGTQGNLNAQTVNLLKVSLPIIEEQKIIGNYFKHIDEIIDKHITQITKLQNLKKAFLAKMFV